MYALRGYSRLRILLPLEQTSKGKMLHDGELAKHLGVVHLDHALVDLAPAVLDSRHVEENGTVFPEGTLLDIVDEADGREIHVLGAVALDRGGLGDVAGLRGVRDGALEGCGFVGRGDGACVLR